jgi:hypothetical protein
LAIAGTQSPSQGISSGTFSNLVAGEGTVFHQHFIVVVDK